MSIMIRNITPDASGWVIIGVLAGVFILTFVVTLYASFAFHLLEWIHGLIAVYGPTALIRRLAWDAVKRLHKWNARRVLLSRTSRTREDSLFAAAAVMAQQATTEAEAVLEAASQDPTLSEHVEVISSAKAECESIRAHSAGA